MNKRLPVALSRMLVAALLIAIVCSLASCEVNVESILQNLPYIGTSTADEATSNDTAIESTPQNDPAKDDAIATDPAASSPAEDKPVDSDPADTNPTDTQPEDTTPVDTDPIVTDPVVTDPTPEQPPVDTPPSEGDGDEIINLGGYVYKAYVRSNYAGSGNPGQDGNPNFYCEDFWVDAEHQSDNALSYAVYMRNQAIENTYNVKIQQVHQSGNMTQELALFNANNDQFDLTIILAKSAAQAATMGLLKDLNSLPYLNLEHSAYDQSSVRELSVGDRLYYLSGDMNISTMDSVALTVVNLEKYEMYAETIVEYFDIDPTYADIHNVVTSGKWTVSTMLEIAAIASVDAFADDGALGSHPWDEIGYYQYANAPLYYFYGAGGRLTEMNDKGVPEFVIQSTQNQTLFDYIFDNMSAAGRPADWAYGYSSARRTSFLVDKSTLFTDMTVWDVRNDLYINADFEYGILPIPVSEEGDDYHSLVHFSNTVHMWAIPAMCKDLEIAQLMMETMAATSDIQIPYSVMDAYYTRILYFAAFPNAGSRMVLNIIKNSMTYDIALLYDWGGWETELTNLGRAYYNNYGSLVSVMPGGAIPQLEETVETLITAGPKG